MTTILVRSAHRVAQCLGRMRADASGNVAVIFALMAVVLMLCIGAAVDIGRWLHARDQTIAAVDAAVLAGGRALQTKGSDTAGAIAAAQKYYTQNVISRLPVTNDTVTFSVSSDGMGITAKGSAYIKTPFLQFASISQLPLISTSQTDFAKSQIAVGGNGGESIEVSMMLDITGSMAGQKLTDLKSAASDLINIGCSTAQARALCTAMKAKGIKVYTVGFGIGSSQTAIDTLTQCATDYTKFYNATDGEQLKQAFRDIALKLSSLYISK